MKNKKSTSELHSIKQKFKRGKIKLPKKVKAPKGKSESKKFSPGKDIFRARPVRKR